jgi:hypothetical protein
MQHFEEFDDDDADIIVEFPSLNSLYGISLNATRQTRKRSMAIGI